MKNIKAKLGTAILTVAMAGSMLMGVPTTSLPAQNMFPDHTITAYAAPANLNWSYSPDVVGAASDFMYGEYHTGTGALTAEYSAFRDEDKKEIQKVRSDSTTVIQNGMDGAKTYKTAYYRTILQFYQAYYKAKLNYIYYVNPNLDEKHHVFSPKYVTETGRKLKTIYDEGVEAIDAVKLPVYTTSEGGSDVQSSVTEATLKEAVEAVFRQVDGKRIAVATSEDTLAALEGEYAKLLKENEDLSDSVKEDLQSQVTAGVNALNAIKKSDSDTDGSKYAAALSSKYDEIVLGMGKTVGAYQLDIVYNTMLVDLDEIYEAVAKDDKETADQYKETAKKALNTECEKQKTYITQNAKNEKNIAEALTNLKDYAKKNITISAEETKYNDLSLEEKRADTYLTIVGLYNDYVKANKAAFDADSALTGGFYADWVKGEIERVNFNTDEDAALTEEELSAKKAKYSIFELVKKTLKMAKEDLGKAKKSEELATAKNTLIERIGGIQTDTKYDKDSKEWVPVDVHVEGKILTAYKDFIKSGINALYTSLPENMNDTKKYEMEMTRDNYRAKVDNLSKIGETDDSGNKIVVTIPVGKKGEDTKTIANTLKGAQEIYESATTVLVDKLDVTLIVIIVCSSVGGLLLLVGGFFLITFLVCKVEYCAPRGGTVYARAFHFPGSVVNPYKVRLSAVSEDEEEEDEDDDEEDRPRRKKKSSDSITGMYIEEEDGTYLRVLGVYTNKKLTKKAKKFKMPFRKKRLYLMLEEVY